MQVHFLHSRKREGAFRIEKGLAASGVGGWGSLRVCQICEGVELDHVGRHVVGPFENLWSDVDQEGIRGPPSQDHYLVDRVIHEEKPHGCSGSEGFCSDFVSSIAEGWGASGCCAGRPHV